MSRRLLERILILAFAALLTACVETVDEVVLTTDAVFDARLIGDWQEIGGKDRVHVERGARNDYAMTLTNDKDPPGQFRARLARFGDHHLLDVAADKQVDGGFPTHLPFAVGIRADTVTLWSIDRDSLLKALRSGRVQIPYTLHRDDLLLHGDASHMRSVVAGLLARRDMLGEGTAYRREGKSR